MTPKSYHVGRPQRRCLLAAAGLVLAVTLFLAFGLTRPAQAGPTGPLHPAPAQAGGSDPAAPPDPAYRSQGTALSRNSSGMSSTRLSKIPIPRDSSGMNSREHRLRLEPAPGAPGLAGFGLMPQGVTASPVITFNITTAAVTGYVAANQAVHLTLRNGAVTTGEARARSDSLGYFQADLMKDGRWATVQAGNVLTVQAGGATTTMTAPTLTGTVTPANDRLAGSLTGVTLPASLRIECWGNALTVSTNGSGAYTADLGSLVDVSWFHTVTAGTQDANGNWITADFAPQNGLAVYATYAEAVGSTTPGAAVQVTLQHGGGSSTQSTTADRRTGWWAVTFDAVTPGDVVTAQVGGGSVATTISALGMAFDLPNDRITGGGPASSPVSVYNWTRAGLRQFYTLRSVTTGSSGAFTANFPAGTIDAQGWGFVVHHPSAQSDTLIGADPSLAVASWSGNDVWGYAQPGASLTATLTRGSVIETAHGTASASDGYYDITFGEPFQIGDQVGVTGGGLNATVTLSQLTAGLNLSTDVLAGKTVANGRLVVASGGFNGIGLTWGDAATAGASGAYQVNLETLLDVHNGRYGWVVAPQGNNVDQPAWQEVYALAPYVNLNETDNGLYGYVPEPNVPVTLTLRTAGGAFKSQALGKADGWSNFGWQQFRDGGDVIDIVPGDRVTVEIPGWSEEVVAPTLNATVNPSNDRVTGVGPADSFVEVRLRDGGPTLRVPTGADGAFMADFAGLIDVRSGMRAEAAIYDAAWNRLNVVGEAPHARANIVWDNVDGWFGPGVSVDYTVTRGATEIGGGSGTAGSDGWLNGVGCGCDMQPGDQVHVTSSAGFDAVLVLIPITGHIDVDADTVSGTMSDGTFPGTGNIWIWSEARSEGYGTDMPIAADGSYSVDVHEQFDIQPGDNSEVWYYDANGNQVGTQLRTLRTDVNYAHDWVAVETESNAEFTVTVAGKATFHGVTDASGRYYTWQEAANWDPSQPDIQPGDAVTVEAASYTATVDPVGEITGAVDVATDTVTGELNAPWFSGDLRVRCEVWVEDGPDGIETTAAADGGPFTCDFSGKWDLQPGQDVAVRYFEPDGDGVINVLSAPYARANVTWDNVDGWFGPGVTVDYTVTRGATPIGAGHGQTRPDGWMNGVGCGCDMQTGDQVHVISDAGFNAVLVPIPITGKLDAGADTVSGTMSDGTFPGRGHVNVWSEGRNEGQGREIDIDGEGAYTADFTDMWNIQPGDQAEVWYYDANHNQVGVALRSLTIEVAYDADWVSARTEPNADITIEVVGKATLTGKADANGEVNGWEDDWLAKWTPGRPDIQPGDLVLASTADWSKEVKPVGSVGAAAITAQDAVTGRIHAPWFTEDLRVRCSIWVDNGPPEVDSSPQFVPSDGGAFRCDFGSVGWDLQPDQYVAVRVLEPDGDQFVHSFAARPGFFLPLILRVK